MSDEKTVIQSDDLLTKISFRDKPYLPDPLSAFRKKRLARRFFRTFKLIADQIAKKRAFDS
jgi:hypothetical protein